MHSNHWALMLSATRFIYFSRHLEYKHFIFILCTLHLSRSVSKLPSKQKKNYKLCKFVIALSTFVIFFFWVIFVKYFLMWSTFEYVYVIWQLWLSIIQSEVSIFFISAEGVSQGKIWNFNWILECCQLFKTASLTYF